VFALQNADSDDPRSLVGVAAIDAPNVIRTRWKGRQSLLPTGHAFALPAIATGTIDHPLFARTKRIASCASERRRLPEG
jgi:hypothetical protein